ncbi:uncharacterized protein LOC107424990 isoform X1 [Ziziphus jujuba]|uniref:Uncharacterized protein LOC107424990 isoform X1 n=2 Tax=Ziziphus jujuba TaxID=326968 RepID=A0ABM4AEA7_ZIZJJ|nr:uncharacterized protein LOC107424990 isoform X1 [Ziziphus jujuba]
MPEYGREEMEQGYEDEYEDYEDEGYEGYEEGEGGGEEEYEEEEDQKPTKEELEFLELRQSLKERIRKQMKKEGNSKQTKKESSSLCDNSFDKKKKLPYDNYGSFFGPSKPVIAQRVIQERKSMLETKHLTPRVSKSSHGHSSSGSTTAGSKSGTPHQRTGVVNEVKTKAQKLKDTRDYSFLLSDDAELPAPAKEPPRNLPARNFEPRSAQVPMKSKQSMGNRGGHGHGGHEERKSVSVNGHMHSTVSSNKLASGSKPNLTSMNSRKQLGSSNGNGPGRPLAPKVLPSNGNGPGRPLAPKGLPSKVAPSTLVKKASAPVSKSSMPVVHKPPSSKLQSSFSKQQLEQRREVREPEKAKLLPKTPVGLSKPQCNIEQIHKPQKPISSHHTYQDNRPKKKPVRSYSDDEDANAISMIRQMFGYNPAKFAGRDDDDLSDMEARFDDIMKEERRSAKIARKEDEEQLRLIEEEERRERLAKKRRLGREG